MSTLSNSTQSKATATIPRPEHHLHNSNEPLPGARGAQPTVDYSKGALDRAPNAAFNEQPTHIAYNGGHNHGQSADIGTYGHGHGHNPARHVQDTHTTNPVSASGERGHTAGTHTKSHDPTRQGHNAFTEDRPLGVKPTGAGGVVVGGRGDLPLGHADLSDKIIGKTQKVAGKVSGNPELHERGELRETGGKAAVQGEARALHD